MLHISAPAFADPDMPAMSPIFLGNGPSQPACVMPLGRFADRTFGLGLVVLDGMTCEPSLHDHELDSPIAAWLASATRAAVATSWRSEPAVSADLFATFHEQLAREGTARSLRRAKRRVRQHRSTSHPFYWAPAILGGDPDWSYTTLPAPRNS